jgi:hypothetical protein
MNELKKFLKISKNDIWLLPVTVAIGGLFGSIMSDVVAAFDGGRSSQGIDIIGGILAYSMVIIMSYFVTIVGYGNYFNLVVSMGGTRKSLWRSYVASTVISVFAACIVANLVGRLEMWKIDTFYTYHGYMDRLNPTALRYMLPSAAVTTGFGMLAATLMARYGRKIYAIVYILFIGAVWGTGNILDVDETSGKIAIELNRILGTLADLGLPLYALGVAIMLILFGISYLITRRQQVNV